MTTTLEQAKPRTLPQVHRAVLKIVSSLEPGSLVLDAPCGEGALLFRLKESGFRVRGVDIDPGAALLDQTEYAPGDLNQLPLPFQDQSFDAVTSVEGIEHLENPPALIREFHRLLKPGGLLVLTTPNITSIRSRVRFLGSGFFHMFKLPLDETRPSPAHHITPLTLPHLRYTLHRWGFEILETGCSYVKLISIPYLIFAPWIALYTLLAFRREKDAEQIRRNGETLRWMLSWPLLMGEHLIIVTRKKHAHGKISHD